MPETLQPSLWIGARDRPRDNSRAVLDTAMKEFVPRIVEWLESDETNDDEHDPAEIQSQLEDVLAFYQDGFDAAKRLESRHHWAGDSELVEILDDWRHVLWKHHDDAIKAWVKENRIEPPHNVGEVVTAKWGRDIITGPITRINHDKGQYVIYHQPGDAGSGAIVNYEAVTASVIEHELDNT